MTKLKCLVFFISIDFVKMKLLYFIWNIFPKFLQNIIKYIYMKWNLDYSVCKIITLTQLINKSIKIWKNVKISQFNNPWFPSWIEINDYVRLNWLNWFYADEKHRVIIGKFCSIAIWATFIAKMHHNHKQLSTYIYDELENLQDEIWETITIWNDVRIWRYAIILKWVNIWNWAVIWAWAVVTKDVPPYAIVWWNPAKIIKYRFDEKTIGKLQKSEWWNRDINKIIENLLFTISKKRINS